MGVRSDPLYRARFDYYDAEAETLEGSGTLAGVKSVQAKAEEKREAA